MADVGEGCAAVAVIVLCRWCSGRSYQYVLHLIYEDATRLLRLLEFQRLHLHLSLIHIYVLIPISISCRLRRTYDIRSTIKNVRIFPDVFLCVSAKRNGLFLFTKKQTETLILIIL